MIEVTRNNFPDVLKDLEKRINQVSFVSIDCEFSKLPEYSHDCSLFVDVEARYKEFLDSVKDSVTLQVGLALFKYNRDLSQYDASVYKFHVCPSFCGRRFNPPVGFNGSSLSFLCQNKFDFNKAFYEGVHCLNRNQESSVRHEVTHDGFVAQSWQRMTMEENDVAWNILDNIQETLVEKAGRDASSGKLEISFAIDDSPFFRFVVRRLIRDKFPNLEIIDEFQGKKIVVVERRNPQITDNDTNIIIDELRGFSKVFDLIVNSKKPLVGHNVFCDLLLMYNQFYGSLPDKYTSYKASLNSMFPSVYDTKLLSRELKLNDKNIPNKSLKELYDFLKNLKLNVRHQKVVLSNSINNVDKEHFHDAGWDAYATGLCFLRLASAFMEMNKMDQLFQVVTFSELLKSVESYKNRINIPNANIPFISLDDADPVSRRPPYLHVRLKRHATQSLNELDFILKNYGNYQKKPLSTNSVLVALSNYPSFKEAVKDLSGNKNFQVERYSFLKHNRLFHTCLLTSLLISSGLTLWMKCIYFRKS